jgi:CheY-like chemotaxis protein
MTRTLYGMKVLLVDDDLLSLDAFQHALSYENAEVRSASTVSDAMSLLEQWIPDVVISDIGIPSEDGLSFVQRLRKNPATDTIPAIAVTGYSSPGDKARMRSAGFNLILTKPIDPFQLVKILEQLDV